MISMEIDVLERFNKIDSEFDGVKSQLKEHTNDDHHVILTRFDEIDKVIKAIQSKISTKNVGYAGIITSILTFLAVIIGAIS